MPRVIVRGKIGRGMKYINGKVLIDTNILVYSIDNKDKKKQKISRSLIANLHGQDKGVISTQVINEFYVVATKKLKSDPFTVKQLMTRFQFEIVNPDLEIIKDAIDISILNKISYWDALIISSATSAKCKSILSEDLNDGQVINGIKIMNPFNY